jgi:nickel-dependent lactate racemase
MLDRNQWEASMQMSETVMGVAENSMRWRMEEAAQIAGLRYIVNTVLDASQRVIGCFAGDPVKAHRAACPLAREVNLARLPHRADIVISDAYPQDRDFWQSAKGMYSGTCAVKDGGTLITVAPNPEGVASNHPNLLEIGYRPHAELVAMVQAGKAEDLVGISILADVAQIVDYCHVTMVSPGVKRKDAEKIGLEYADTVAEALQAALQRHGPEATIAVLHHGGHVCPVADDTSAALGKLPGRA